MSTENTKKLKINIGNYVKRLKDIDFMQPLYEAVVNSIDANATNIKITFMTVLDEKQDQTLNN